MLQPDSRKPFPSPNATSNWALCGVTQGPCSFMEASQGPMSTEVWSSDGWFDSPLSELTRSPGSVSLAAPLLWVL